MEEQSATLSKAGENGSIDQHVSTTNLRLVSAAFPNLDDINSTPILSNTTLHFSKGDSKIEIIHENNSHVLTATVKEIRTFYSVFMRIFQFLAFITILLMMATAGLGIWWGTTSAIAGEFHTPLSGSISLPWGIGCIVVAAIGSFWTGVTGGPVVWHKASYAGKSLDTMRIAYVTNKKYYLYEAEIKVKMAKKIIHSIQIDIKRFYDISSQLMRYLMYKNTGFNMQTGFTVVMSCLQTLNPPEKTSLTKLQKNTITDLSINNYTIDVKKALAEYCIGKARKQFTDNSYKDKKLDTKRSKLYKTLGNSLKDEATNLATIEATIFNLIEIFSKLKIEFETGSDKYYLGKNWEKEVKLTDVTTNNIISNFFTADSCAQDTLKKLKKQKTQPSSYTPRLFSQNADKGISMKKAINNDISSLESGESTPLVTPRMRPESNYYCPNFCTLI